MMLMSACATPSIYIAPAQKGMSKNEISFLTHESVPVLDGHRMGLRKVDGVPVGSFFHVYLSPGWHYFEYGFRVNAGCREYRHTQVFVDYGIGVLRDPSRDRHTCIEPIIKDYVYSGWFLLESGRRYQWTKIHPLLKKLPETPDPSPYDKSVPGLLYKNG
jgi:hypothetical protein